MAQFSNAQRLSILVAASCRPDLKDEFVDVAKVAKWIVDGDEWAIAWEYDFLEKEAHPMDKTVEETCEIFDMYLHFQISDDDELKAAGLTKADIAFSGFDLNNDKHYHVARVLVDDLERYNNLPDAASNSHSQANLRMYRTLLDRYRAVIANQATHRKLASNELRKIFGR